MLQSEINLYMNKLKSQIFFFSIILNIIMILLFINIKRELNFTSDRVDKICEYMIAPVQPEYGGDYKKVMKFHKGMMGEDEGI